jgi:hypothetical protein
MAGKQIGLTAAALLVLTGCASAVSPPPPPTAEEKQRLYSEMLDRSWVSTGLSEKMTRPRVTAPPLVDGASWDVAVTICMAEDGDSQRVLFHWEPERGFYLDAIGNQDASARDDAELRFFVCASRLPRSLLDAGALRTQAQLEYQYDDYRRRIVPCLLVNGLPLASAATRAEFTETQGAWTPYQELPPEVRTSLGLERLVARCEG